MSRQHSLVETMRTAAWRMLECPFCGDYAVRLWSDDARRVEVLTDIAVDSPVVHSWTP